jgi:hypothetical protein
MSAMRAKHSHYRGKTRQGVLAKLRGGHGADAGVAMMTVILAGAVLTALAMVASTISINNLRNTGRDRVAGGALGAAEAGLAEGVSYLSTATAGALNDPANPWGNPSSPMTVTYPDGRVAKVYITVVQKFQPPSQKLALYTIHSTGTSGSGPGTRVLEQTVTGKPAEIPIGVYANNINVSGTPQTYAESVFTKNCISGRNQMRFGTALDPYFGIPPSAHSIKWISEKNSSCSATETNNIHRSGVCNPTYPYDQDALGGPITSPCSAPNNTSKFTQADLDTYGRGLNQDELALLRTQAKSIGQYWTSPTGWVPPDPNVYPHAVMFFDVGPNDTVTIQSELDAYYWDGATCSDPATPKSIIIIVNNSSSGSGGMVLNSNSKLAGAIFVQNGSLSFNGSVTWTGTIWADVIERWNGSATAQLTPCFLQNLPGGLMRITPTRFREVDR